MEKPLTGRKILLYAAIFGNAIYVLWLIRNAIDSGFKINVEAVAVIGLLFLLILNVFLLYQNR